jgi:hypothetical protein
MRVLPRGRLQPAHSGHRRGLSAPGTAPVAAGRRVRARRVRAVARQTGANLAGGDHAVLGRRGHAAVHRAEVGRRAARAVAVRGGGAAGRGGGRHRARCGCRGSAGLAARIAAGAAGRGGDGCARAADDPGRPGRRCIPAAGAGRRVRGCR